MAFKLSIKSKLIPLQLNELLDGGCHCHFNAIDLLAI